MYPPAIAPASLAQHADPGLPIAIILDDRFAPIAARGDVVEPTSEFDSQRPRHACSPARWPFGCTVSCGSADHWMLLPSILTPSIHLHRLSSESSLLSLNNACSVGCKMQDLTPASGFWQ